MQIGSVLSVPWSNHLRLVNVLYIPKKDPYLEGYRYISKYVAAFIIPASKNFVPRDNVIPYKIIHDSEDSHVICGYRATIPTSVIMSLFTEIKTVPHIFLPFILGACYERFSPYDHDDLGQQLENTMRKYIIESL